MKGVGSLHSSTTNQPLLRYLQLQCYKTHASVELQPGLAVVRNVHCLRARCIATQAHCCQNHCGSKVLHNTCCLIVSTKGFSVHMPICIPHCTQQPSNIHTISSAQSTYPTLPLLPIPSLPCCTTAPNMSGTRTNARRAHTPECCCIFTARPEPAVATQTAHVTACQAVTANQAPAEH